MKVKRLDGYLFQLLPKMTQDKPKQEWDQHLADVLLSLRVHINLGTGFKPVNLDFGEPA